MTDSESIDKAHDKNIKYLNEVAEKSKAYTNLIIFGGYASFFGLWLITKDYISPTQAVWSALLMLVSIFIFIVFEISKVENQGRQI